MAFRSKLVGTLCALLFVACAPKAPRPNVLLITVDTLRADGLGAARPELLALGEESVVFQEGRSSTSWTLPALASLMTGTYSSTHGCLDRSSQLDPSFSTLAEHLEAAGYATGGVASHVFLKPKYGLAQGFEFYDESLAKSLAKSHEAVSSPGVTQRALAWLDQLGSDDDGRPFFLWAHYFDPHEVYREHRGFSERYGVATEAERYRGEVDFTAHWLGLLLAGLQARGLDENTIVVLVADHGEEFGDHGSTRHGHTLYDELLRVPFLLRVPDGAGALGKRIQPATLATPASLVDVLPTLLELCDVAPGSLRFAGISLVPAMLGTPEAIEAPRPLLAEVSLREGRRADAVWFDGWKLIRHRDGPRAGESELYALQTDPTEQVDLASERVERRAQLERLLDELLAAAAAQAADFSQAQKLQLDEAEKQNLADLGYTDAGDEL